MDGIIKLYTQVSKVIREDFNSLRDEHNKNSYSYSNPLVIHSAIAYLDIVLSHEKFKEFEKAQYKTISLVCLSIAAKFNELDDMIPLSEEYIKFSNLNSTSTIFIKMEKLILEDFLHWNLHLITPYNFVEIYVQYGIIFNNDTFHGKPASEENIGKKLKKSVEFF